MNTERQSLLSDIFSESLKKKLCITVHSETFYVVVHNSDRSFYHGAYYDGELYSSTFGTFDLQPADLQNKIKEYKSN